MSKPEFLRIPPAGEGAGKSEPIIPSAAHEEKKRSAAPTPTKSTLLWIGIGVVAFFGALFFSGYWPLFHRENKLAADTKEATTAAPRVRVARPTQVGGARAVPLPGTLEAIEETTLYARVAGYVKRWRVDMGDHVREGEVLLEIETPELNQERLQAEASVAQTRARLETSLASVRLARSSFDRYKGAADQGGISPQELAERSAAVETAVAAVDASKADILAGEANVRRIREMLSFAIVRAPFPGIITRRMIEIGALVTVGNASGQALFRLARIDPIKVLVSVPQDYAALVKTGATARLSVREYPNHPFSGLVTRSSGSLDVSSRTLLTQIEIPNADGTLIPGMYGEVALQLSKGSAELRIPASAMIVNADGTEVALLTADDRVHFQKIVVTTDFGTELAVNGISPDDRVIIDPSTRLSEGVSVTTVQANTKGSHS